MRQSEGNHSTIGMLVLHKRVTTKTIISSRLILTGLLVNMGGSRVNTL